MHGRKESFQNNSKVTEYACRARIYFRTLDASEWPVCGCEAYQQPLLLTDTANLGRNARAFFALTCSEIAYHTQCSEKYLKKRCSQVCASARMGKIS